MDALALAILLALATPASGQAEAASPAGVKSPRNLAGSEIPNQRRTVLSAMAFLPMSYMAYRTSPSLGRFGPYEENSPLVQYYATLDLPAGAVIDFIGVNSTTDVEGALGFALYQRDRYANVSTLCAFSLPAHGWDTDYSGPLDILIPDHVDKELVLQVEQAPNTGFQFFAWVEIWWHPTVSPAPAEASFNDVPTGHPFFQFVEALAASGITAGCGGGLFCIDGALTRGQMAVFLAKALGLHWPD
jgi:hypothetical protein